MSETKVLKEVNVEDELKARKKELFRLIDPKRYVVLIILFFLSSGLFIYAPIYLNTVLKKGNLITAKDIVLVVIILLSGYLIQLLSVFIKNNLIYKFHGKAVHVFFRDICKLNYDKYNEIGPTALITRAYESAEHYAGFYFETMPSLVVNIFMAITVLIIAFTYSITATIFMIFIIPIQFFGFKLLNKKLFELSKELSRNSSENFKKVNSIISQVDFIKQNHDNSYLLPKVQNYILKIEEYKKRVNYLAIGASQMIVGIIQILQNISILVLASLALKETSLFGGVIYIMLIFPYFSMAIRGITSSNLGFANLSTSNDFLITLIENKEEDGKIDPPEDFENIEIKINNLKVGDKILLNNINMFFKKGDVVGIKGESGKGKSTLLKLIPKFRKSTGLKINGLKISDMINRKYLSKVSYYSQNTPIITDTIIENLNFGRKKVDEKEYRKISFLNKFTNLNEVILENGANLSGGDKQRISLARFFTEDSKIVVLDEPTSSLDKKTESEILDLILKDNEDKIIFLISHSDEILNRCNIVYEIRNNTMEKVI